MDITIDMIKQLREATAAGMGACKEALKATDGNMDEAVKYLREKGLAVAAKRVDKESKQGIVALAEAADKKSMALAEVNCETDFVANTDAYKDFCKKAAAVALEGKNIEETLMDDYKMLLTKTGENVKIRRSERYQLEGAGVLSGYIHMGGLLAEVLVAVGVGDEVGLAVDLGESHRLLVRGLGKGDDALLRLLVDALGGDRETLLAEVLDGLVHVAVGGLERFLAGSHAGGGRLAELLDHVNRDVHL